MLSTLDAFILRCVGDGINTAYALKSQAGLSLGASVPAIRRLQRSGLLKKQQNDKSGRTRTVLSITAKGNVALESWRSPSVGGQRFEPDEFCREFVLLSSVSKKQQEQLLARALASLEKHGSELPEGAISVGRNIASEYKQLLQFFKSGRASSDSQTLKQLIKAKGRVATTNESSRNRSSSDESTIRDVIVTLHQRLFSGSKENGTRGALEAFANRIERGNNIGVLSRLLSKKQLLESWSRELRMYSSGEPEVSYYRSHFDKWLLGVTQKRTALAGIRAAMEELEPEKERS